MFRTDITGIGDPFVLLHGGKYYLYATSAEDGFLYWTSDNLKDWEKGGYCYKNPAWGYECFWAPEVFEIDGKFYMLYTARWTKNKSLRIGLAVADKPEGPFVEMNDGPLFDFGYAAIDATLLTDDDGRRYIYYSRDCSENKIDGYNTSQIYVFEISRDLKKILSEPKLLTTPDRESEYLSGRTRWNEGPFVIKQGGKYHLNYSMNCYATKEYALGVAVSDSPMGEFKKYENNPILSYRDCDEDFSGPGHNCVFMGKDGNLYTSFHIHTFADAPSGNRRAVIARVEFDEGGNMQIKLDQ